MNFSCFWWGHEAYVAHKGWYVPYKERVRAFGVSIHCSRCKEQVGFRRFTKEISNSEALKSFFVNEGEW
jgi:hypothetical protein